jgi:putative transcriptional regulator
MGSIINNVSAVAGKKRMQVSDLAREAKVSYDTVKRLWYGTAKRVDLSTLASLCEALNCQPGDLFVYTGDGNDRGQ